MSAIYGRIFFTTNGGSNWQEINTGFFESLEEIYFVDINNGWAVGGAGTILRSRDGGNTWTPQFSDVATNTLSSICFIDTLIGWASGEGGTIIHTIDGGGIVSVENENYPNPFNPSTKISWQSPLGSWQTLKVYDVLGNQIGTLVDEYKPAGKYEIEFNAGKFTSGVYFYQLKAGDIIQTKKMILVK